MKLPGAGGDCFARTEGLNRSSPFARAGLKAVGHRLTVFPGKFFWAWRTWLSIAQEDKSQASSPAETRAWTPAASMTKLELLRDGLVTRCVGAVQVIQQAAALADHHQQATA